MTVKQATLEEATSNVIENLSMMVVEKPVEWENFNPQLEGCIEFIGPVKGKLYLRCEDSLAQALAENLLGSENTDLPTPADAWDALAELLNVVCGNLVTELFDSQKPFTLSPPQINIITPPDSADKQNEPVSAEPNLDIQVVHILLDGHPIEIVLEEKQP